MSENQRLKKWRESYDDYKYTSRKNENITEPLNPIVEEKVIEIEEVQEDFIGFRKRSYALVIDLLVLSPILFEINNIAILLIICSLYYAVLTSSPLKATIGKLAIGAIVVDGNGQKLTFIRALLRFYSYLISVILCFISLIFIIFDNERRSLHDFICNTYVIDKNFL